MNPQLNPKQLSKQVEKIETATLGMGWFWGPDARFGHYPGVIRTRVGYAGGTKVNPTYREMGDHTEIIEMDFDPTMMDYSEILNLFWAHHHAQRLNQYRGRQYMSLLLYHNDQQKEKAIQVKQKWENEFHAKIQTEINAYTGMYLAEDKHQKYYLKRFPKAYNTIKGLFSTHQELVDSTLVTRLNGFVREFGSIQDIERDLMNWGLTKKELSSLITRIRSLKW